MAGALDGIKVLDLSIIVQGPQAAALLHDMGADVTKIELPGLGDLARWIPVGPEDPRPPFFVACNRGKRSATLDLRTEGGHAALLHLVRSADIMVTNFQPGTLERWNLGYDALAAVNPGLILATGSALGPVGPDAEREGADGVGQAVGGLISTTGVDGGPHTMVGAVIADHIGSLNMVAGILAALHHRNQTGRGQQIDVSLYGGQIWAQASEYTYFLLTGKVHGRSNRGHPMINALYRMFETADGDIVILGVPQALWPAFCDAVELPELATDERFATLFLTPESLQTLKDLIAASLRTKPTAHWVERLRAARARFAPVNDYADVAADAQVWANGYLKEAVDENGDTVRVVGNPIRFSDTPMRTSALVPALGQHTEEVLLESGLSWEQIDELRRQGAY